MKTKILFLLFLLCFSMSYAQEMYLFNVDTSNLPEVSAEYLILDSANMLVTDIKESEFGIKQDTANLRLTKFRAPQAAFSIESASIVLTIDISGSMYGQRMDDVIEAAKVFVGLTPLYACEIAITAFNGNDYILQDFTQNKEKLLHSLDRLEAGGGTDFNSGLLRSPGGALSVTKNANYDKKAVLFLTDGLGTGNFEKMIKTAKSQNVKIYPITFGLPMPQILKNLSQKLKTRNFPNIEDQESAQKAYIQILNIIVGAKPGFLRWKMPYLCSGLDAQVDIKYENFKQVLKIPLDPNLFKKIELSTEIVDFGTIKPGDTAVVDLSITAINGSFSIQKIAKKLSDGIFSITPDSITPFSLKNDTYKKFKIYYTPKDSNFIGGRIQFLTQTCPSKPVFIYAGKAPQNANSGNLKLITPNGGEHFGVGTDMKISWEGVPPLDQLNIFLSKDAGRNYIKIGEESNGYAQISTPNMQSDSCMLRITHSMISNRQYSYKLRTKPKDLAFSDDGDDLILTYSKGLEIRNKKQGKLKYFYFPRKTRASYIVDHEKNKAAAVGEKSIKFIDIPTFVEIKEIKAFSFLGLSLGKIHKSNISAMAFSQNDSMLSTADIKGNIKIWDYAQRKNIFKGKLASGKISFVSFCNHDKNLLIASRNTLLLYNISEKKKIKEVKIGANILNMQYVKDTLLILSSKFLSILNTNDLSLIKHFTQENNIKSMTINPAMDKAMITSSDNMFLYTFPDFELIYKMKSRNRIKKARFSPDGQQYIAANGSLLEIWSTYKRFIQTDISDSLFSIVGGLPKLKSLEIKPAYRTYSTSKLFFNFLENKNNFPIKIKDIFLVDTSGKFSILSGIAPYTVGANSSHSIEISFVSNKIGIDSAKVGVVIGSDTLYTNLIAHTYHLPFRMLNNTLNFGVLLPQSSKKLDMPVFLNTTNDVLTISKIHLMGGANKNFRLKKGLIGKNIAPGEALNFTAVYYALEKGTSSLGIEVYFKDYEVPANIVLFGRCKAPHYIVLKGVVRDILTNKVLSGAKIQLYDNEAKKITNLFKCDSLGNYEANITVDRDYTLMATDSLYTTSSYHLDLRPIQTKDIQYHDFYLEPDYSLLDSVIYNLFFESNRTSISNEGIERLNGLVKYLNLTHKVSIKLEGHTDNVGTESYNKKLSLQRAKAVKSYLVKNGIKSYRVKTYGKGTQVPVAPNDTPENKQKNRRVEIYFIRD